MVAKIHVRYLQIVHMHVFVKGWNVGIRPRDLPQSPERMDGTTHRISRLESGCAFKS